MWFIRWNICISDLLGLHKMGSDKKMISTSFLRQCFVTSGVSLNVSSAGFVLSYTAVLLHQLALPGSPIPLDHSATSWIAALPGFTLLVGNLVVPSIMTRFGRRFANLISMVPLIVGWTCIIFAVNVPMLLLARFLQSICMGMTISLGSLLIGEYTSPKNRGAFLMTISVTIAASCLLVHSIGFYYSWRKTAFICAAIALANFFIVLWSPESPNWLAEQGRYEDCKRVFRWLRGADEEEELKKLIEASVIIRKAKQDILDLSETLTENISRKIAYFSATIRKKEFSRPIIIMIHIYSVCQWSGVHFFVAYGPDLLNRLVGSHVDISMHVILLDLHRIIANILGIYIIKKIKRRTMWFSMLGLNIATLLGTAAYSFAKETRSLPFDHPAIGIVLTHVLVFAVAAGTLSLSFIIAGEIFPLEHKNLAGGISVLFYSGNMFLALKSVPYLLSSAGVWGTYLLLAGVLIFCLLVTWCLLPETKDRTLQDIEDDFREEPLSLQELKTVPSLPSLPK